MIFIYGIKNLFNDKYYIGKTNNVSSRIECHFNKLKKGNHENINIQKDFNLGHSFEHIILQSINLDCDVNDREKYFISKYKKLNGVYNIQLAIKKLSSSIQVKCTKKEKEKFELLSKSKGMTSSRFAFELLKLNEL